MQKKNGPSSGRHSSDKRPGGTGRSFNSDKKPSYRPKDKEDGEKSIWTRPSKKNFGGSDKPRREGPDDKRSFRDKDRKDKDPDEKSIWTRPSKKDFGGSDKPFKTYKPKTEGDKPARKPFPKRDFGGSDKPRTERSDERKSFRDRDDRNEGGADKPVRKPFPKKDFGSTDKPFKAYKPKTEGDKPFKAYKPKTEGDKPFKAYKPGTEGDKPFKAFKPRTEGDKPYAKPASRYSAKPERQPDKEETKKEFLPRIEDPGHKVSRGENPNMVFGFEKKEKIAKPRVARDDEKRPFKSADGKPAKFERKKLKPAGELPEVTGKKSRKKEEEEKEEEVAPEQMPLNKYIAHCGVCSRRDAAILVKEGQVKVNGVVVTEPGHKMEPGDAVTLNDKKLTVQKGLVYILLNKPKDYITTNEDPQGRKTVMDLVDGTDAERLFPVGRLDRNTTGLLLITNDGALAQKLSHPSYKIKKVYQVTLDKPLTKADSEKIVTGVELEDGVAHADTIAYLETKSDIGIEIHSGRNRIVRRIFEALGYEVVKLDRVMYAGLTKKNIPRGRWRYLNEREIVLLKHFKS